MGEQPTWRALALGLAAVALVTPLLWRADNYQLYVLALVALTAIVGIGLNVLVGLAGQFSLGHVAFYGIGAYTVAILTTKAGLSFWVALPFGALLAGAAGIVLAIPALAVRGPYLAMVTIAFGFIFEQGAAEWGELTGGWNGITGIPTPSLAGRRFGEREIAVMVLVLLVAALWLYARLSAGPWGRAMRAVRDGEVAAQSIGLSPTSIRTLAFALSAVAAGAAGGIFAAMSDFISPESFPFLQSILFILVVMIGGVDRLWGPLVGALIVVLLPELLSWLAQYRLLFVGLLLLVILRLAPTGVVGLAARFRRTPEAGPGPRAGVAISQVLGGKSVDRQALIARDLAIGFGGVQAVRQVSFEAASGRITSLIGPNGAGKSTVLNLACGFYRPDQGEVRLGDVVVSGRTSHWVARHGVARTFQTTQLFAGMSVLDNVRVARQHARLSLAALFGRDSAASDDVIAESLLAFVGYTGPLAQLAGALPHVDKRLVEIARALATGPLVLMLDEPAAGLDSADKERLGKLLRGIADCGVAVVLVEHDMSLVMAVSDHVVVLDAGRKIAEGPPAEVARNPLVLQAYLGEAQEKVRRRKAPLAPASAPLLTARALSSGYGAIQAIRGIDLSVSRSELVAVIGANGAGKSTLMRALSGLNRPVGGEVQLAGERIEALAAHRITRLGLALVPEGRQVFPELSVTDNLRLGAYARPGPDVEARLEALLDRFPRLRERRDQRAGLLSGGEQQMLAIARGLIGRPEVLMLDEPSLGLAPTLVEGLYDLLATLREEGTTIVLVDQMTTLALSVADRGYVIRSGAISRSGEAAVLARDPAVAEAYLGRPAGST